LARLLILLVFFFLTAAGRAVTRFYFPSSGAAAVNPKYGLNSGGVFWNDTASSDGRYKMVTSKISSSMVAHQDTTLAGAAAEFILFSQYVSDPLEWQMISGTFKGQIRARESNAAANATLCINIYIVSSTGSTFLGNIIDGPDGAPDATTTPPEFFSSATVWTNRRFANIAEESLMTVTNVIVQQGDRIVVEFGFREVTTNATRAIDIIVGDNSASDLAENQTTTAANNPWLEFSQTLTFYTNDGTARDTLRPNGNGINNNMNDSATANCGATASNWDRVNDTTTVGAANNDLLEVDATVAKCNQGTLVMESEAITDYGAEFITIDTLRWMVRARTTSGVGGDSLEPFIRIVGAAIDTNFGPRVATGTTWGNWYAIAIFNDWRDGQVDSIECGVRFKTTTASAQQEYTEGKLIVVKNVPIIGGDWSPSGPSGCDIKTNDTLYPVGTGFASGLQIDTNQCTVSSHWDCVNEEPGATGCSGGVDSVFWNDPSAEKDYYKLGTRTDANNNTRWGQRAASYGNANRIIDCIQVVGCFRRSGGGGGSPAQEVTIGLRDSAGNEYWDATQRSSTNVAYLVTAYFPNQSYTSNARWDSVSLLGLEVIVRFRMPNIFRRIRLNNLYVLVGARNRDTTIADSTNSDMQVLACSSIATINYNGLAGSWMSWQNSNRVWQGFRDNDSRKRFTASNDTGRTWYWLSTTSDGNNTDDFDAGKPDTVTVDAYTTDGVGYLSLFESSISQTDSFSYGFLRQAALDSPLVHLTKKRQQTASELKADRDSFVTNKVAILLPAFYKMADTVWMFGGTALVTGKLWWGRAVYNNATTNFTWLDSGYIQGPDVAYNANVDTSTLSNIGTTTLNRRIVPVRWSNNYPALFIAGWSAASQTNKIVFRKWHAGLSADSARHHAWHRKDNVTAVDSVTISNTGILSNVGEMVGTSVYRTSDTIGHAAWYITNNIVHASVKKGMTTSDVVRDTAAQISATPSSAIFLGMTAHKNSHDSTRVYLFWNYFKNASDTLGPSQTDTSRIMFQVLCAANDNKWRFPRPLAWMYGTNVQMKFPVIPQYQTGRMVLGLYSNDVRGQSPRNVCANRIVYMSNPAAGGAAPAPLRRRRWIIEKNYKTGEIQNEKDSISTWVGLRLPDTY